MQVGSCGAGTVRCAAQRRAAHEGPRDAATPRRPTAQFPPTPLTSCLLTPTQTPAAAPRLAAPKAARAALRRPTLAARATSAPATSANVDTTKTPASQGFTMPGEFEKHAGCWMGWPYDKYLWRGDALPAKKQYAAVAKVRPGI